MRTGVSLPGGWSTAAVVLARAYVAPLAPLDGNPDCVSATVSRSDRVSRVAPDEDLVADDDVCSLLSARLYVVPLATGYDGDAEARECRSIACRM